MYLRDIPWHTRCFDRSKDKTDKLWENLTFTYFYVNIKYTSIELTRRLACCWACASAALNLCVSSVCSAASGAVRCSCPTMSTRHKNCKEDQRSFALRGIHTPWTHSLQFSNFVFGAAEPEARAEQTKCHHIGRDMGEKWPASGKKTSTNCISLNWYDVCRRHLHSFPGTRKKGTNCASLWKLLSLSFHLLLLLFGQGSCGSMLCLTWRWKKRRGKAQPSNNSSILFHGHIHNLAEK